MFFKRKAGKIRILKKYLRKNKQRIKTEYTEVCIEQKSDPPFRIIKYQFGFRKAIYREFAKNDSKLEVLFALANVFRVDQMI